MYAIRSYYAGAYSSEYVVATKTFGDRLRVTGGLGWGRLGSQGSIGSMGERRSFDYATKGGTGCLYSSFAKAHSSEDSYNFV